MKCVVFTGGGTGGHIFPGLAVAEALSSSLKCRIVWIGSAKGVDRKIVESSELYSASPSVLEFMGIPAGKLRRYFSFQNFIDVFKVAAGFIKSFFILLKLKPIFVFSKGGFVSVPPCAAAKFLKIPVITHECDFSPGLATRINSKFANRILVSYQETAELLPASLRSKVICTGNPVRLSFYSGRPEKGLSFLNIKSDLPVLFVLGGSLGARQLAGPICVKYGVKKSGECGLDVTEEDLMETLSVGDVMLNGKTICSPDSPAVISENVPLSAIIDSFSHSPNLNYAVKGDDGRLTGMISLDHLKETLTMTGIYDCVFAMDIMQPADIVCSQKTGLKDLYELYTEKDTYAIPIIGDNGEPLGMAEKDAVDHFLHRKIIELHKNTYGLD